MPIFLRLTSKAAPIALLVISSLWTALFVIPFLYSLIFPHLYLREAIEVFEGQPVSHPELAKLGREVTESFGPLKHAIRLAAYYSASVEYKSQQMHKTKEVQYTYLVRFEKRPHFAIMGIGVSETDGAAPTLDTWPGSMGAIMRMYLYVKWSSYAGRLADD